MTNSSSNLEFMPGDDIPRLNFVRLMIVLAIAFGYTSTMPLGPEYTEKLAHLGYDPSWIGIQLLFFFSGFLALKSLRRHGSSLLYLKSRFLRNIPLLAIFTLITVIIIYPALGVPADKPADLVKKLATYYFQTVSCIDPGNVLPGLLDDAKYACIIQGAVWTFRWGLIAHIGTALCAKVGMFKHNGVILGLAAASTFAYFMMSYMMTWHEVDVPNVMFTGLHLAFPFLSGMAAFAYQNRFPKTTSGKSVLLGGLGLSAIVCYLFLPWTPAIEIFLTAFWAYVAWLVLTAKSKSTAWMTRCPDLTLCLYLVMWPTAQLILLGVPSLGSWELIGISLPLSLGIAYLSHLILNRRIRNFFSLNSVREVTV